MAKQILSQQTRSEAFTLSLQGHTWHKGRSKRTGAAFYLIPSRSNPKIAHRAARMGCTCTGFLHRGDCVHTEAIKIFEAGEAAARKPLSRYDELIERHLDEGTRTTAAF